MTPTASLTTPDAEDLPWLFQAVDDLVDDLHVKPQKWAGMAEA